VVEAPIGVAEAVYLAEGDGSDLVGDVAQDAAGGDRGELPVVTGWGEKTLISRGASVMVLMYRENCLTTCSKCNGRRMFSDTLSATVDRSQNGEQPSRPFQ